MSHDKVLEGVVRPPGPRDEVVDRVLRSRRSLLAIEARLALSRRKPASDAQRRCQTRCSEKVISKLLLFHRELVEPCHHAHPMELHQGAHQGRQSNEMVTSARHQPNLAEGVLPEFRHRGCSAPAQLIDERLWSAVDDLEVHERIASHGEFHHIQRRDCLHWPNRLRRLPSPYWSRHLTQRDQAVQNRRVLVGDLPELDLSLVGRKSNDLWPVESGDPISDLPRSQDHWCSTRLRAIGDAAVDQRKEQRELVGRGPATFVDDGEQTLSEPSYLQALQTPRAHRT